MLELFRDDTYVVEYDRVPQYGQMLTIARRADGMAKTLFGHGLRAGFEEALARYGADRTLASYIRAAGEWQKTYKTNAFVA